MGLAAVLLVSVLLIIVAGAIHGQALSSLQHTARYGAQAEGRFLAQGGFQVALSRLKVEPDFEGTLSGSSSYDSSLTYSVEVTNNRGGAAPRNAPDGTEIPIGSAYLSSSAGRQDHPVVLTAMATQDGVAPPRAVMATDSIDMSTSSRISAQPAGPITVTTNVVNPGGVSLSTSSQINGDLVLGPGADPNTAVDLSTSGNITGGINVGAAPATIQPAPLPAVSPPFSNVNISTSDDLTLAPGNYGEVDVSTSGALILTSGTYYIDGDFQASTSSGVRLLVDSGPVVLFIGGDLDMSTSGNVNVSGPAQDLEVYLFGSNPKVDMSTSSEAHMVIHGPDAELEMSTSAKIVGSFVGRSIDMSGSSQLIFDMALAGAGGPSGTGRWVLHSQRTARI